MEWDENGRIYVVEDPGYPLNVEGKVGRVILFEDTDGDGKPDIFLPDNGPQSGMALYHNLGAGKFEDVTKKAGLDPAVHAIGCTAGDYDNDGFPDILVTAVGQNRLFQNTGKGYFADVTAKAVCPASAYGLVCLGLIMTTTVSQTSW